MTGIASLGGEVNLRADKQGQILNQEKLKNASGYLKVNYFLNILFIFRERRRRGERGRKTSMCGLPLTWPTLGTWPETQACALTGN